MKIPPLPIDERARLVDATTHNGGVKVPPAVPSTAENRSGTHRECRFGDGAGRFTVATHNGDVDLRRAVRPSKN